MSQGNNSKRITPINRVNKFYGEEDFRLEVEMGREYTEGDLNMYVILYKVNLFESQIDDLYGQPVKDGIQFYPPVEVKGIVKIEAPEMKNYQEGKIQIVERGNLTFSVYQQHLDELGIDIKRGDYLGYPETPDVVRFWQVENPGSIYSDNQHTILGYKGFYKTIVAVPVDNIEFRGK